MYVVGAVAWCAWVGVEPAEADALGEGGGRGGARKRWERVKVFFKVILD